MSKERKTNLDIIRQMSDDEIVDLMFDTTKYFSCEKCRKMRGEQTNSIFCDCQEDCRSLIKQWLYMNADDETSQIKKYKCDLCLDAEDWTTGTMMLTKEEYEIVKRVTDISNWDDLEEGSWSGHFYISCEELEKDGEE